MKQRGQAIVLVALMLGVVVGMAALFNGIVRAPLTGVVLVIEMTAAFSLLLPMLGACFAAMLVATLLRAVPIYEALREATLRRDRALKRPE